jgi:hypothetical protein
MHQATAVVAVQYLLLKSNAILKGNSRYCISNLRLERSFKAYLPKVMHQATAVVAVQFLLLTRTRARTVAALC